LLVHERVRKALGANRTRSEFSSHDSSASVDTHALAYDATMAKRSEKPKKSQKQQPQKTLKERRTEKRAARRRASGD
jgi:hypothetical protein